MPASSARCTGALNAFGSTMQTAIAAALAAIAALIAFTISAASLVAEPVHCDSQPSSAQASWMPYCVGTKNGLVVTWLTKTKRHFGCDGNGPAPALPEVPWAIAPRAPSAAARSGADAAACSIARRIVPVPAGLLT